MFRITLKLFQITTRREQQRPKLFINQTHCWVNDTSINLSSFMHQHHTLLRRSIVPSSAMRRSRLLPFQKVSTAKELAWPCSATMCLQSGPSYQRDSQTSSDIGKGVTSPPTSVLNPNATRKVTYCLVLISAVRE